MGLLDAVSGELSNLAAPFNTLFGKIPDYMGRDFEAFVIEEIVPQGEGLTLSFVGEWMPKQPFKWGGEQHLVKEYYPGNAEPTVQVLGAREGELKVTGRFKVKKLKVEDKETYRELPMILSNAVDELRKRGSLVKLMLGEWQRWGFIEGCDFTMKTLADIEYEIRFFIIGDKPPSNCKITDEGNDLPVDLNLDLIKEATALEAIVGLPPEDINLGIFDQLNQLVGTVATALAVVTKFVDGVLSTADNAQKFANRAVGLIKYAQATISTYKRRVGQLNAYLGSDPLNPGITTWSEPTNAKQAKLVNQCLMATSKPLVLSPAQKLDAATKTASYSAKTSTQQQAAAKAGGKSIDQILADMLVKFKALAASLPQARYLVKAGDTLQKISVTYYHTPDQWKKIYDHNKLQTTVLVPGVVLEIPRI